MEKPNDPSSHISKSYGTCGWTLSKPTPEILVDGKSVPNPACSSWVLADHRAIILLQASLTEEAFSELVGLSTAYQIWTALERAYSNSSIERVQALRDQLRQNSKGSSTVADFGRKFKSICDQLFAVGHPVDESDKIHWFLCGLESVFETFSTAVRASRSPTTLRDLLAQAEAHELFLQSLHVTTSSAVAFTADTRPPNSYYGRGGRFNKGGHGRGRRPPHC